MFGGFCDVNTDIWLFSHLQPQQDVLACRWSLGKKSWKSVDVNNGKEL